MDTSVKNESGIVVRLPSEALSVEPRAEATRTIGCWSWKLCTKSCVPSVFKRTCSSSVTLYFQFMASINYEGNGVASVSRYN